jgi:hypothetical protein
MTTLPLHLSPTTLHIILEPLYIAHLSFPMNLTHHPRNAIFASYTPHSSGMYHLHPNPTHPFTSPLPDRLAPTLVPTVGVLNWNWQDFVYVSCSKKKSSSPLGAAAAHPAATSCIKILVRSTPLHPIDRAELAGIDIGLPRGHEHLLTNSACSVRLQKTICIAPPLSDNTTARTLSPQLLALKDLE